MPFNVGRTGLAYAKIWHEVDAKGRDLDTLAKRLVIALQGKYKPTFHPNEDFGDFVVVKNARHISVEDPSMVYRWHTGWPKGKRELEFKDMIEKHPCLPIMKAVYNRLSKDKRRRELMRRLKVFPEEEHPFQQNIFKDYTQGKQDKIVNLADLEKK